MTTSGSYIINNGGFDFRFSIPTGGLTNGSSLVVSCPNINTTTLDNSSGLLLTFRREGAKTIISTSSVRYILEAIEISGYDLRDVRVFMHNAFLSLYINKCWIHTFYFMNIEYPEPEDLVIKIYSVGDAITVENILLADLLDWRDAIFVDLDSTAANAVSSVIQQRPVEVTPTYLGEVRFRYSADELRSVVPFNQKLIVQAAEQRALGSVISDAIVYGAEVEVITDEDAASHSGFITRIIRVPELTTGARRAAKEMLKQARQKSKMYSIVARSDLQLEVGDILQCTYNLSATGTSVAISCIIESIKISLKEAIFTMEIVGRSYDEA